MNQAMNSFLLNFCCCILTINTAFLDLVGGFCLNPLCKGMCYLKNGGFDYGYCENNKCQCKPSDIYVFDGIDRNLNNQNIPNSLGNNGINQRKELTFKDGQKDSTKLLTTIQNNESVWANIVKQITTNYAFIKVEDLQNLKAKIIQNQPALDILYYNEPLQYALTMLKDKFPNTSEECKTLLELLTIETNRKNLNLNRSVSPSQSQIKQNVLRNVNSNNESDLKRGSQTTPSNKRTVVSKTTNYSPNLEPSPIIKTNSMNTDANTNKQNNRSSDDNKKLEENNSKIEQKTNYPKPQTKQTVVEEENQTRHIEYETVEETIEDSDEESSEDNEVGKTTQIQKEVGRKFT